MRDQDADCVAKPRRTSRCCNSMWSRAFCDTRTGEGGCSLGMHGSPPKRREKKARRSAAGRPSRRFGPPRRSWRTHSLCQEPSETGALSPSTLVRNAPLSVQNRTNLPDTLGWQSELDWLMWVLAVVPLFLAGILASLKCGELATMLVTGGGAAGSGLMGMATTGAVVASGGAGAVAKGAGAIK